MWGVTLLLTAAIGAPVTLSSETQTAAADLARVSPALQKHMRYLSCQAIPEADREEFLKSLAFHINSLSTEAECYPLGKVSPTVYRINLLDYGWKAETWDKLAEHEPYFHTFVEKVETVTEYQEKQYGRQDANGRWYDIETRKVPVQVKKKKRIFASAPWVDTKAISYLIETTGSQVPVVRADWFLHWTGIQVQRGGAGYYDFLGIKSRDDFDKLVALDKEAAKRVRREIAAIVAQSGVALNNRQIIRYQTITGGYWVTLDVIKQDAKEDNEKRNALRLLDGDFVHDAEEIYGVLPNGLLVTFAGDAKGVAQDTVPDTVASDSRSTNNDRRIHPGMSCIRCHDEGIKPIDDWARRLYRGPVKLTSPDYEKLKRLKQLYLSDLEGHVKLDQQLYAAALKKCNGLEPEANAKAYGKWWSWYLDPLVTITQAARELGVEDAAFKTALQAYAKKGGDPVLIGLLAEPPLGIRREHWEEVYPIAQQIMGYGVANK